MYICLQARSQSPLERDPWVEEQFFLLGGGGGVVIGGGNITVSSGRGKKS